MPTYEYACDACGHQFETFQSMKDDPLTVCPKCEKPALRRLIFGGTGVIFKGSGFYVNDSKKSGKSTSRAGSGSTAESGSSTESGASESTTSTTQPSTGKDASTGAAAKESTGSKESSKNSGAKKPVNASNRS